MCTSSTAEAPQAVVGKRLRRMQRLFTAFCMMSIAINFLDRATIGIANVEVRHDFGLTATAVGSLISVWSLSYSLGQLPAGFLVDRFGPRLLAGGGMLIWSICQGLGGITTSFQQLFWLRGALGVAEAPTGPSNAKVVATWFPPGKRGVPTGVYVSGTAIGPAIAPPLLTALMVPFGWRTMFIVMGAIGVLASMCWFLVYRDTRAAGLNAAERAHVGVEQHHTVSTITMASWARLFRTATVLGIICGSFGQGFIVWIYGGWLPAMLETQYHVSIQRTGILAALPWVGGIIGALSGGFISDFLTRRGFGMLRSRTLPIVAGLLGLSLFTAMVGLSGRVTPVIVFSFLALLSASVTTTVMWTATTVLVPRDYVASLGAVMNFSAFLGATISPTLTGYTVDLTGSFDLALFIGAGIGISGAVLLGILIRHPVSAAALAARPVVAP
jgi:sugar phosphate permease